MFTALITKHGVQVDTISTKTEQGAEFLTLDYIDDKYDAGEEDAHEAYDYEVVEAEHFQPPSFTYVEDGQTHEARTIDWDAVFA